MMGALVLAVVKGGLMTAGYLAITEKVIDYVDKKVSDKKESK
jgi:hypothetical protein